MGSGRPFGAHATRCAAYTDVQVLSALRTMVCDSARSHVQGGLFLPRAYLQVGTCIMRNKYANKSAPKPPHPPRCVGCARPMQLVRRTPRFGGLRDVYCFECRDWGEVDLA